MTLGERAAAWVRRCFGDGAMARTERAARLLEEAVELAQAEGVAVELARAVVERAYARPPGDSAQEAGGVGMCLAAWSHAAGVDVALEAEREMARVEALPADHFRARHAAKVAAGSAAPTDGLEGGRFLVAAETTGQLFGTPALVLTLYDGGTQGLADAVRRVMYEARTVRLVEVPR